MQYLGYLVFAAVAVFIFLYNSVAMKNRQLELVHARILAVLRRRREIAEQAGMPPPETEPPRSTAGLIGLDAAVAAVFRERAAEVPEELRREFHELDSMLQEQTGLYRSLVGPYNAAAGTALFSLLRFRSRELF